MELDKEKISLLCKSIKNKKTLSGLKEEFILKEINRFLLQNPKQKNELLNKDLNHFERGASFKETVKGIRQVLHKYHGSFKIENKTKEIEKEGFLKKLKEADNKLSLEIHKDVLETSLSTKERIEFYDSLYKDLFKITSPPKSILDLGSGMNPLSFPFMGLKNIEYLATEINEKDINFLNSYFAFMENKGLKGRAVFLDLNNKESQEKLKEISRVDICFAFKLFESIELSKKKKFSKIEEIIKNLSSDWIVVSFPTKTLSQKEMNFKKRIWFELMLKRLKLKFFEVEKSNEIFYVIRNKA